MRTMGKCVRRVVAAASAGIGLLVVLGVPVHAAENFRAEVSSTGAPAIGTNTAIVHLDSPVGGAFGAFRADTLLGYLAYSGNGVANRFPLNATATAWYQETLTIFNAADPTAQAGILNATVRADQYDALTGACGTTACAASQNTWTIAVDDGPSFTGGDGGGPRSESNTTLLPIAKIFTFGEPFTLKVTMTADAGFGPGGPPGFTTPTATYLFTDRFWWQGISSVTDAQGNAVAYTIRAGSHVDWRVAAIIPEPSPFALTLAGLLALAGAIRRAARTGPTQ